jgi:hypothetical protein
MNIDRVLAACVVFLLPAVAVAAEDSVTRFRLAGEPNNQTTCRSLDAVLARPHTVTVKAGDVEITSAGGIEGRMKPVRNGVYRVRFELSGLSLDVVADLGAAPRTLTVSDGQRGCKWLATPE